MKKVLVTGGNKGIGKACCQMLLEKYPDVHVLLGSRDASRGSQAVQDIEKVVGQDKCQGRLDMVLVDTSSDESVATAAASVQGPLYGIINNAGIISGDLSQIVNVNYLGPRRVTDAFLSKVQRPGGRIVNVCSASGPMFVAACADKALVQKLSEPWTVQGGIAELDGIAKEPEKYAGDGASYGHYGFSKALLTAYTWILAKEQPDLIINSVTPGFIKTDMTEGEGFAASNPPSKGAEPVVFCLMEEELTKVPTGRYYGSDCKRSPLHEYRGPGDPVYEGPDGK